ncbi:hypothetical protein L226DRAFT_35269 [Lentinus tigrinus ALCF2SS1-7]|uniref:uncharacterized protein n=1 Tax=Lentinus tigrinus ALCF2SS1-7 TaxID=1328758 RepID=UPI001165F6A4|nr:hypothetical protein L226DRAFT_35269 [Lentinus tigrinus ALCF2SS1-7]
MSYPYRATLVVCPLWYNPRRDLWEDLVKQRYAVFARWNRLHIACVESPVTLAAELFVRCKPDWHDHGQQDPTTRNLSKLVSVLLALLMCVNTCLMKVAMNLRFESLLWCSRPYHSPDSLHRLVATAWLPQTST